MAIFLGAIGTVLLAIAAHGAWTGSLITMSGIGSAVLQNMHPPIFWFWLSAHILSGALFLILAIAMSRSARRFKTSKRQSLAKRA
jgi:hypothetical protein